MHDRADHVDTTMALRMQVCARAAEGRIFAELTALLARFHEDDGSKRYVCFWARNGHAALVAGCPLLRAQRTTWGQIAASKSDPERTSGPPPVCRLTCSGKLSWISDLFQWPGGCPK